MSYDSWKLASDPILREEPEPCEICSKHGPLEAVDKETVTAAPYGERTNRAGSRRVDSLGPLESRLRHLEKFLDAFEKRKP